MSQALEQARSAIGITEPNPRVGCVIGSQDGNLFGVGATQQPGGHHAEIMALRQAEETGVDVRGATAWVTLEPCAHFGRTPPCCDALVRAGLRRVVVAVEDPFAQVAGLGIARLRAAGVQVDRAGPDDALSAWELNVGFFSRVLRGRPWIRVKTASSLDGRTSLLNGVSQWITSDAARIDGHAWRKRASAVLTGVGTVLADDPRLDVRLVPSTWQPLRVVLDSRLRTPPRAQLYEAPGKILLVCANLPPEAGISLPSNGVEVLPLAGQGGRVDLAALALELARRGVNEVHVEAGPELTGALLQAELVDEILAYVAPRVFGPGRGLVNWPAHSRLDDSPALAFIDSAMIGSDLRLRLLTPEGVKFFTPTVAQKPSGFFTVGLPPE